MDEEKPLLQDADDGTKSSKNSNSNSKSKSNSNSNSNLTEQVEAIRSAQHKRSGALMTFMQLVKSNMGAGILTMPQAMSRVGLIFAPIFVVVYSSINLYAMNLLLDSSDMVKKRYNLSQVSYADAARYSVAMHNKGCVKKYHLDVWFGVLIDILLLINQIGTCTAYIVFTSSTLKSVTNEYFGSITTYIMIIFLLLLFPVYIKDVELIGVLSTCANILCVSGLLGIMFNVIRELVSFGGHNIQLGPSKVTTMDLNECFVQMTLFMTSILYTFEGISSVLPLKNVMRNERHFKKVLCWSNIVITSIILILGCSGIIAYGKYGIEGSITLSMPKTTNNNIIKMVYGLGVFNTYFIQFYIAINIVNRPFLSLLRNKFTSNFKQAKIVTETVNTFLLLSVTVLSALLIPKIENVISLIGATACSWLSLIAPPVIHTLVTLGESERSGKSVRNKKWFVFKNGIISFLGVVLFMLGIFLLFFKIGIYSSVYKIVRDSV